MPTHNSNESKFFHFKKYTDLHNQIYSMRGINPAVALLFPQSVKNNLWRTQKDEKIHILQGYGSPATELVYTPLSKE